MKPVTETRAGAIFQLDDGVVLIRIKSGVQQSVKDAQENLSALRRMSNGVRLPLLIDLREAEPLSPDTRHYYSGKKLSDAFSALALIVQSSVFGRMMGNVYLKVARPGIPTQLFNDETDAVSWLRGVRS